MSAKAALVDAGRAFADAVERVRLAKQYNSDAAIAANVLRMKEKNAWSRRMDVFAGIVMKNAAANNPMNNTWRTTEDLEDLEAAHQKWNLAVKALYASLSRHRMAGNHLQSAMLDQRNAEYELQIAIIDCQAAEEEAEEVYDDEEVYYYDGEEVDDYTADVAEAA